MRGTPWLLIGLSISSKDQSFTSIQQKATKYNSLWLLTLQEWVVYASTTETEVNPMQAYCVKCPTKREMRDPRSITMKNGRPATQGTCPSCGTKMFTIGKA